jgi:hypothetical protein
VWAVADRDTNEPPRAAAESVRPWSDRLRGAVAYAAPALLAYLGLRLVGLVVLWVFVRHWPGAHFWTLLGGRYDSIWYRQIAERGYDRSLPVNPDGSIATTNLNFFPLFPALMAALAALGLPVAASGLVVSWVAGPAAAWGMFLVGDQVRDRHTGIMLAALWAVLPYSIVQNLAYSETLFTALAAWSLWHVLRRDWLWAAGLCLLAGLTRPAGYGVIAAVCLAALLAIRRREGGWRPWTALVTAPLGYLGYLVWVGIRLRRPDAYLHLERASWHMHFDGGRYTLDAMRTVFRQPQPLEIYVITLVLAISLGLLVLVLLDRLPLPLLVYAAAMVLFAAGTAGSINGKGRYLLPAFVLLLPIAGPLAKARLPTVLVVFGLLAAVSSWYGTYLLLLWPHSP